MSVFSCVPWLFFFHKPRLAVAGRWVYCVQSQVGPFSGSRAVRRVAVRRLYYEMAEDGGKATGVRRVRDF